MSTIDADLSAIGNQAAKIISVSHVGTVQLAIQEAHWLAQAAQQNSDTIRNALATNKVPLAAIRESEAMADGLAVLAQKAIRAFNELAKVEAERQAQEDNGIPGQ